MDGAIATPLLMVGAGHMGGALVEGWLRAQALAPTDLSILDPSPGGGARRAIGLGANGHPTEADLQGARTVVLAVRPQSWRAMGQGLAPRLAPEATIVSIMAGVGLADIEIAFPGRRVARAMPNLACATLDGATSLFAADPAAQAQARALFAPLGAVVELEAEDQLHAATAACGSAGGYVFALVEALEAAGRSAGLPGEAASVLAREAVLGAAAMLKTTGQPAAVLRAQIASPGGTTEAGLKALTGEGELAMLIERTVQAAAARSRELARLA